ncbi:MAG: alcohol dehydrogenase catalytic domain-containing protein [Hyphomicrobiales bacterium]
MKAAFLRAFGSPLTIEEVDDPRPGPGEAVIRVMACGIDGTDLKLLDGFGYTPELPFVMGHEPAGVVESLGEGVTSIRPGDRVIPYIFLIPPESRWFGSEREQLCPEMTGVIGVKGHPGGYAERLALPAHQLVPIPEGVAFHDAAVHCDAGLTAFHAVRRARITLGENVLVIGVGGVGSFAVQYAELAGARVIALDKTEEKRAWARELGAEAAAVGALKVDCVLDIVGTEESIAVALDAVSPGGRIVVVGYTPDVFSLSGKRLAQNEIEILGSRAGSRRDLAAALDLFAQGRIRSIVTDRAPLTNVNEALAKLRTGNVLGRMVLEPG